AELDEHSGGDTGNLFDFVGNAKLFALRVELFFLLGKVVARAVLQFLRGLIVKAFDAGELFLVDKRQLLDRGEAFGGEQLRNDFIDIERVDESFRARLELGLTTFGFFLLGKDVDIPAGELRRETYVLAATADRERQLRVRHDHLDARAVFIEHDLGDFSRGERVDDEGRNVGGPRNNVDLLALKLVDDSLHARAAHTDAGADRVDGGVARNHGDLRARAGIAGDGFDLDNTVVNLRHFLREEFRHELRMRAR